MKALERTFTFLAILAATTSAGIANESRSRPSDSASAAVPALDKQPRQLVSGVYSLGELNPVYVYAIEAADGIVLVDTGFAGQTQHLIEGLESLGLNPQLIRHIVVTHFHLDHWMIADAIRSQTGAKVYMGKADAKVVEAGAPVELVLPARIAPPDLQVPPTVIDHHIDREERLSIPGIDLTAIPTPGHTPGSVSYLLEIGDWRILFGGDVLMSVRAEMGTYMAALHPSLGGDSRQYRTSIERLRLLPVNMSLPGHPYFDREESGADPNPVLTPNEWQEQLDRGIQALDLIEARDRTDGRDFLDDIPKQILPSVYYLGRTSGTAAYAFQGSKGLALVDPIGMLTEDLETVLLSLDLDTADVESVLLSRVPHDSGSALRELFDRETVAFRCGPAADAELTGLGASASSCQLAEGTFEAAGLAVEGIAAPTLGGSEGMSYVIETDGHVALLSGQSVSPLSADRIPVVDPRSWQIEDFEAAERYLTRLEQLSIDLWLPARPFANQNANLYDDAWSLIVGRNLQALNMLRKATQNN